MAERNPIFRDETLIIHFGKEPIGIIPLSIHGDTELRALSAFGRPIKFFFKESKTSDKLPIYKSICYALEELVVKYATSKTSFLLNLETADKAGIAQRYSKSSIQWHRLICDLNIREDLLFSTLRKSYQSLIRKFSRVLEIEISNSSTAAKQIEIFKNLHLEASGRTTRSDETWKYQLKSILSNEAFIVLGKLGGEYIGASLINTSSRDAYYGVGAYSREMQMKKFPVAHVLIWEAIKFSKSAGLQKFILSEYAEEELTSKEESINFFKRGFVTEEQKLELFEIGN